jgi:hypothetical protein
MKLLKQTLYIIPFALFISCKTISTNIQFENKRTPLNPIAHKGVDQFNPSVQLTYREYVEEQKLQYQQNVDQINMQYQADLEDYKSKTVEERAALGLTPPKLKLPEEPQLPVLYDEEALANKIDIQGMDRGNNNALTVVVFYEPIEYGQPTLNESTRKRKKNEEEFVDTLYRYTIPIKQPVSIYAASPLGEEYNEFVPTTLDWKKVRGPKKRDSITAYNEMITALEEREQKLGDELIQDVNTELNSQFGTVKIQYSVTLYSRKPSKKFTYTDLDQAKVYAEKGLQLLLKEKNKGIEEINRAYMIWTRALSEHQPNGKGRITHKVKRAILKNLIVASIFTENWAGAEQFIQAMEQMKLSGGDKRELGYLKSKYQDLKARYDALNLN